MQFLRMFQGMNLEHLLRTARARVHRQTGAFDLPSIMIGVAVVAVLTVGVLAAIFGVIPWTQDNAAKQDLAAVHTAQGAAFAKDGGFRSKAGLVDAKLLPSDVEDARDLDIRASDDGRRYVGVSTSETGRKFIITSEAPSPRPLAGGDAWPDGGVIDDGLPDTEAGDGRVWKQFRIHDHELVITQAMKDFSDANVTRKANGEPLEAWDGGGWSIIVDFEDLMPGTGESGVLLTTDGEFTGRIDNLRNDEGFYLASQSGAHGYIAMNRSSSEGELSVMAVGTGKVVEKWSTADGIQHRVGGPAEIHYGPDRELLLEAWFKNGELHRENGPAKTWVSYPDLEPLGSLFFLEGVQINSVDDWISAGKSASDWSTPKDEVQR